MNFVWKALLWGAVCEVASFLLNFLLHILAQLYGPFDRSPLGEFLEIFVLSLVGPGVVVTWFTPVHPDPVSILFVVLSVDLVVWAGICVVVLGLGRFSPAAGKTRLLVRTACSLLMLACLYSLFIVARYAYFSKQRGTVTIGTGSITYELPTPTLERNIGRSGVFWRTLHWTLRVEENGSIELNGETYGKVQQGDSLRVSWKGKIFINGYRATPQ
jgi:hypothetical protein